jgi:quercetin dioxygenase-like cupin family protein
MTMAEPSLPRGGVQIGPGKGNSFWLLTDLHTFKVVGEDTNGAFTVAELTAGPEMGPPPHIHRNADESFYILEGTFEFSLAGQAFTAGAGSFVYLPKGVVHTHQAGGGRPAKALVLQTPAGVERFIAEAGTPAPDVSTRPGPPDQATLERIVGAALKHGIEVPQP